MGKDGAGKGSWSETLTKISARKTSISTYCEALWDVNHEDTWESIIYTILKHFKIN